VKVPGRLEPASYRSMSTFDTLAYFGMPISKNKNTKQGFIDWVNKYLKAEQSQPYQYCGIDVYGARCALLHAFSSEADFHQQNPGTMVFGYSDGGRHCFDPSKDPSFAIIGIPSLVNDFITGVQHFLNDLKGRVGNPAEKSVLEDRLNKIIGSIPLL
jgi:hypothetical protein